LPNSQSQKRIWILGTVIAIVVLAAGGWFAFLREEAYAFKGAVLAGEPAVDLALTDQHGEPFSLESQRGKVVVVYFGYTYCPDFCPTTMLDMMQVSDALGEDAGKFQLVMVSVDPARDTPERLDEYLEFYDPAFIGLSDTTGADALRDIQRGYGVMSAQQDSPEGSDGYLVDHSTSLFGIDPEGNLVLTWQYGAEPSDIAADIEHLLND
jgi:protein SCO1/2